MFGGIEQFKTFAFNMKSKAIKDMRELDVIEILLTPPIEKARKEFDQMHELVKCILKTVDNTLEGVIAECKTMNDELRGLQLQQDQLEIQYNTTQDDIAITKGKVEHKREVLSESKSILSNNETELENRKSAQKTTILSGIGLNVVALPLVFVPVIGPALAIGVAATGVGTQAYGYTAQRTGVEEQKDAVKTSKDEVSSCESFLVKAEKDLSNLETEKLLLGEEQSILKAKLQGKIQLQKDVISLRDDVSELDAAVKKCVNSLATFYGRFKVLHTEVVGGYMIEALREPTEDVCSCLRSLMKCNGFRAICEDVDLFTAESEDIVKQLHAPMYVEDSMLLLGVVMVFLMAVYDVALPLMFGYTYEGINLTAYVLAMTIAGLFYWVVYLWRK